MTFVNNKLESILSSKLKLNDIVSESFTKAKENSNYNCFLRLYKESAETQIENISKKIKNGKKLGPLAGYTIALKDNISYKNHPLTCGSKILKSYSPVYNSHVVDQLLRDDAVIIGHCNMDEFAMGSSNENSAFGPVKNALNPELVSGGSSGGSAVAVSLACTDISLGSETGGSVRQPAAFNDIYGLKPTYGRVSRRGLVAFGSSLDQISPMARNINDLFLLSQSIFSHDSLDSTSVNANKITNDLYPDSLKGKKIGFSPTFLGDGLQAEIRKSYQDLCNFLKDNGAELIEVDLEHCSLSIAVYYIIATAEASANLARFDGIRYGHRTEEAFSDLHDFYELTRNEGFGEEVKRRILLGTFVLSHGYYDAYYRKAQQVRKMIKNDFDTAFKHVDLILTPTTPTTAFKLGEKASDPLELYLADIYTAPVNLAGNPAISIPSGYDKNGSAIGLQFISNHFNEDELFKISHFIETNYKGSL
jgi:aspartyl-tRNA(Asn)/glutamyl-tRNA(Gln) amidotransferase subunit A